MNMKNKIERRVHKEKIVILDFNWEDFKREVDKQVASFAQHGYSNPGVCADEYEIWIEMTKEEDDESFNRRKADSEKSEQMRIAQRIEKLRKEAKELGLKIND